MRPANQVFIVHIYDNEGYLYDYYAHQTRMGAVRAAAAAVVMKRESTLPAEAAELLQRTINAVYEEPGVDRWHVRCAGWHAHIDEMRVAP